MIAFQGSVERKRHASIENHLSLIGDVVKDDVLKAILPGDQANLEFVFDNLLYVPNIQHGEAIVPKKHRNQESIPVFGIAENEEIRITTPNILSMHRLQREKLSRYIAGIAGKKYEKHTPKYIQQIEALIDASNKEFPLSFEPNMLGMVARRASLVDLDFPNIGKEKLRRVYSRPILAFPTERQEGPIRGFIGVHELQHVVQGLNTPVARVDTENIERQLLREELDAYHIEVLAIGALYNHSTNPMFHKNPAIFHPLAFNVDQIRRENNANRKDMFEPTATIRNEIAKINGFDLVANNINE